MMLYPDSHTHGQLVREHQEELRRQAWALRTTPRETELPPSERPRLGFGGRIAMAAGAGAALLLAVAPMAFGG